MRTAEEIMKSKGRLRRMCSATKGSIISAIKDGQADAIKAAAQKVGAQNQAVYQSILSLLNEIK